MANVRPKDLDPGTPLTSASIPFDSGSAVQRATPAGIVDAAIPLASQADAEAGSNNAKRMTPLRVAQAITAQTTDPLAATTDGNGAGRVGYLRDAAYAGETVGAKLQEQISVRDFGAIGNNTDDDDAFVNATALGVPVLVPLGLSYYLTTSLNDAQWELLWGPGLVKDSGTLRAIANAPQGQGNGNAGMFVDRRNLQPSKWSSVEGSLQNGLGYLHGVRTGGYGSYGLLLVEALIDTATPPDQFDVGITSAVTHRNLTGGSLFAAWFGANTPAADETYTGGGVVGFEANAGNRYGDEGKKTVLGTGRYTVGGQIVADVTFTEDGETVDVYPGTFGLVLAQSVHDHKWWTGLFMPYGSVMPAGDMISLQGAATAPNAVATAIRFSGYSATLLDFSASASSNAVMKFGAGHTLGTASAGGGASVPATVKGFIVVDVNGASKRIPYFDS